MKKKLAATLSVVLILGLAVLGILAYLTDTDSDVNVMTLGNVSIEQHEYQRATDEDGTFKTGTIDGQTSYVLEGFEQLKPLLPIVGDPNEPGDSPAYAGWDVTPVRMTQVDSYGNMQVFAGKNAQDKFVTVENTGKSDAYVRTLVAIEVGEADPALIGKSYHSTWSQTELGTIEIEGNKYSVFEYVYAGGKLSDGSWRHENGVVPAGDTTYPNLAQVYMKSKATNDDCEKLDGNGNGALDILVLSQAVQVEGFVNAQDALDTAFGDATEANVKAWFEELRMPTIPSTPEDLQDSLNNGEDVIVPDDMEVPADQSNAYGKTSINVYKGQVIDGGNHVLEAVAADGTWDTAINATGGTVKNLTVAKGFRGLFVNHNADADKCGKVVLENVTIDGCTYTISCDQGTNNGLDAYSCTFNGWTSYAATLGNAKFVDCSFGEGNGYAFMRPFAPTDFVGCEFEAGFELDPRAAVTFENCTIGGVALTADNLATLVTSNIANATVK